MLAVQTTPSIYVACLAAYNNGILHGAWLDVPETVEELQESIQAVLKASPIANAEEWEIHDSEGLGDATECSDIAGIVAKAAFINEHGELGEALIGHCCGDLDQAIEMMDDRYHGLYESEVDYAEQHVSECYDLEKMGHLAHYIDYEALARDMFFDMVSIETSEGTHVFSN